MHFSVAEFRPKILNGVQADQRGAEHADPLDTADTADRKSSHTNPECPLGRERLLLLVVELGPAEDGGESKE